LPVLGYQPEVASASIPTDLFGNLVLSGGALEGAVVQIQRQERAGHDGQVVFIHDSGGSSGVRALP
jgi:hypothetical protein